MKFINSKVYQYILYILNIVYLNLLFILTSVISLGLCFGSGMIAVFRISNDLNNDNDSNITKRFFKIVKANFKFGLILFLFFIAIIYFIYINTQYITVFMKQANSFIIGYFSATVFAFLCLITISVLIHIILFKASFPKKNSRFIIKSSLTIVLTCVKEFILSIILLFLLVVLTYIFPYSLIITFIIYIELYRLIYKKRYYLIAEKIDDLV